MSDDFYLSHQHWEDRHPEDLRYALQIAEQREKAGYQPSRQFPCRGTLRFEDDVAVRCDVCGFTTIAPPARPFVSPDHRVEPVRDGVPF